MNNVLTNICESTIDNYKMIKEDFRYDGEYINHFASLIYAKNGEKIASKKIKKIRTFIKDNTSRISSFRGDILYILSFLIGTQEEEYEAFIQDMLATYNAMVELGFNESQYLVLTSYTLTKNVQKSDRYLKMQDIMEIYKLIKGRYDNVTNEQDYLATTLLVMNDIKKEDIIDYMDNIFESIDELDMFSKNSVQGLTLSLLLNQNASALYMIHDLLLEFESRDMKISHQILPLIGIASGEEAPEDYVDKVKDVIDFLCEEDPQYEYYMDKSFRAFIAVALIELSKKEKGRYINEFLSLCIYSFLVSKNQCLFAEILA